MALDVHEIIHEKSSEERSLGMQTKGNRIEQRLEQKYPTTDTSKCRHLIIDKNKKGKEKIYIGKNTPCRYVVGRTVWGRIMRRGLVDGSVSLEMDFEISNAHTTPSQFSLPHACKACLGHGSDTWLVCLTPRTCGDGHGL